MRIVVDETSDERGRQRQGDQDEDAGEAAAEQVAKVRRQQVIAFGAELGLVEDV